MKEDEEPPAEPSPSQSEVTVKRLVVREVLHIISGTPPASKVRPPDWRVPPRFAPFKRTAWVPVVEEGDGAITDSKFAGTPWLGESEEWPRCPNCERALQLFIQLDLAQLPEAVRGEYGTGLLQMFYCTNDEAWCEDKYEAWAPFAESVVVRLVEPSGGAPHASAAELEDPFPPKRIVGWCEVDDYPDECEELGVEFEEWEWEALGQGGYARPGDKLAGWPNWIQDMEYPDCPVCGESMRLVFQIDSGDNLPLDFGDVGCAHITQCATHKDQLGFGWACS